MKNLVSVVMTVAALALTSACASNEFDFTGTITDNRPFTGVDVFGNPINTRFYRIVVIEDNGGTETNSRVLDRQLQGTAFAIEFFSNSEDFDVYLFDDFNQNGFCDGTEIYISKTLSTTFADGQTSFADQIDEGVWNFNVDFDFSTDSQFQCPFPGAF